MPRLHKICPGFHVDPFDVIAISIVGGSSPPDQIGVRVHLTNGASMTIPADSAGAAIQCGTELSEAIENACIELPGERILSDVKPWNGATELRASELPPFPDAVYVVVAPSKTEPAGAFVEVEDADGRSVRLGDWEDHPNGGGLKRLRVGIMRETVGGPLPRSMHPQPPTETMHERDTCEREADREATRTGLLRVQGEPAKAYLERAAKVPLRSAPDLRRDTVPASAADPKELQNDGVPCPACGSPGGHERGCPMAGLGHA